jgi:hypothetical protein
MFSRLFAASFRVLAKVRSSSGDDSALRLIVDSTIGYPKYDVSKHNDTFPLGITVTLNDIPPLST